MRAAWTSWWSSADEARAGVRDRQSASPVRRAVRAGGRSRAAVVQSRAPGDQRPPGPYRHAAIASCAPASSPRAYEITAKGTSRDFHFASRIRAFIHQHASPHARFLQRTLFRSQLPSGGAALDWKPTGAPAFRVFLRHRSTRVPCLRRFVALRPRVSLPALAAPRSSAACRRTVAGSDALPPAGASSTAHASPAGPRFSLAAAGDSSATSA